MHAKRNQTPATAGLRSTASPTAGRRGPLMRACRLCWDLTPVGQLRYGCCPECAVVLGEPARDAAGRFIGTGALVLVSSDGAR
jgi:hypothetical protein